jgi:nucleotide-binding universal stress UspA family protein
MKILVTLDGSHFSETILEPVAKLARALGADVELFRVGREQDVRGTPLYDTVGDPLVASTPTGTALRIPQLGEVMAPPAESRGQAVERLEAEIRDYLLERAKALVGVPTSIHVEIASDPAAAIIDRARREGVDLIAMATHGRGGVTHLLAGSVCEKVIRSGVAPVLALRPDVPASVGARPAPGIR